LASMNFMFMGPCISILGGGGNMTDLMCIVILYSVHRIWCEQNLFIV